MTLSKSQKTLIGASLGAAMFVSGSANYGEQAALQDAYAQATAKAAFEDSVTESAKCMTLNGMPEKDAAAGAAASLKDSSVGETFIARGIEIALGRLAISGNDAKGLIYTASLDKASNPARPITRAILKNGCKP